MLDDRAERVVVGVDFSPASEATAQWVARFYAPEAEVILTHCLIVQERSRAIGSYTPVHEMEERARGGAEQRLGMLARSLKRDGISLEVRSGNAAAELAAVAVERGAQLIALGPHGERGGIGRRLGSTAERLIRGGPVPVLSMMGAPQGEPRRILVPIDETPLSSRVLSAAAELARRFGAEVIAKHVLLEEEQAPVMVAAVAGESGADSQEANCPRWSRADARSWLVGHMTQEIGTSASWRVEISSGRPTTAILAAAESRNADLIVMGRRGRGRVTPAELGSTVSSILRNATCPVLVVGSGPEDDPPA